MERYIDVEKEDYGKKVINNVRLDSDKIDIVPWKMIVSNVVSRIKDNAIMLDSDFQRGQNLWKKSEQSRLIESMIINIPLPIFYLDHNRQDDVYTVIDGLQRMCTIKNFIIREEGDPLKLRLQDLEYLPELNGKSFEELSPTVQRKINEFELNTYIINASTPSFIKKSIFKRINTGGLVLNDAEIRNAAFYGNGTKLLKQIANSEEFINATDGKIIDIRMEAREIINRILSLYILGLDEYTNFDDYYDLVIDKINKMTDEELSQLKNKILNTFSVCSKLFEKIAFRRLQKNGKFVKINVPILESVVCSILRLMDEENLNVDEFNEKINKLISEKKTDFINDYIYLLNGEEFNDAVSKSTAKKSKVVTRNELMLDLFKKFI